MPDVTATGLTGSIPLPELYADPKRIFMIGLFLGCIVGAVAAFMQAASEGWRPGA
jgi:hypothetical protein